MKFHDTLNEKLFNIDTMEMLPEVREKLLEIADSFIEFLEIPTDAVLDKVITGSSASYNYNKYSDLDLHIIVDYDKVHEDCPLVNGYLNSLKKQFNDNHDIFIHGVPVELYAEQKDQGTVHNGLYSLQTGWIDKPQKIAPTDNDAAVEAKYNEIKELVDKCDDSEEATELLEKIYNMRKAGLAEAGEFCTENLAFKKLRNEGCMDKLRQIKKEQIDKQLSLESYNESLEQDVKELTKTDDYYKVDGSRVSIKNGFGSQIELMDLQNLGKKLEKKGYKVYCSNYYIDAKKNESIKESLQSEYKQAFDLLVEGTNQICLEDSDTVKEIMKKFDKLKTIKSDKLKLKKAKELLLDISGYMIDEKFDDYQKKIDKFMNNSKNESVNEENNCGWKKFGKNGEILKCGYYVAKIARQAVGNNYIATLNIKYKKQPLNMQTFEDKEEAKKWLENKLPKNESIKESEDELTLEDKLINILTKDGWNHLNGRGGEFLEKDNITIGLYVDSVIFNEFEDDEKELPLETEEDLQNILNQINELKKNESIKEAFINEPNKKIPVYFSNYVENGQFVSKPLDIVIGQYYAKPGSEYIRKVTGYDPEYNNVWVAEYNPSYDKILRDKSKDYRDFENLASQEQIDFFNKVQQEQENKEQNIEHYAVMDKATGNVWTYKTREERDKKYKDVRDSYSGSDYIDVRKAYLDDDGDFVKWESYCNKNESIKEKFDGNTISGTMTDADLDDYKQYLKLQYINGEIDAEKLEQEITLTDQEKTSLAIARYNKTHGIEDAFDKLNKNESIKEDNIEGIVNSLINKYGKEKLQKGLQTPYQKDYIWGLLHREKGLDLTAILDCLKSKLNESMRELEKTLKRNKKENIKENKMENLDRALFQVGKELGDMELTPTVDAILGRMCELMGLPYDAADEIAWIKEAAEKWIDLLGNKPLAPQYMKGSISARTTFYQFILDRYKRQYEQAIGMDEDVDTLEKKMDDVDTTLKDLMDKINGMSEEVEDTEFDIDKANKLIDEALKED